MAELRLFNPNPAARNVGDCAVRAVAKAFGVDWETAYTLIAEAGYQMGDMPSSNSVWGAVLRRRGFFGTSSRTAARIVTPSGNSPMTTPAACTLSGREIMLSPWRTARFMIPGTAGARYRFIIGA